MREQGRIPLHQLAFLLILSLAPHGVVYIPSVTTSIAGRDAVFGPIGYVPLTLVFILMWAGIQRLFPGKGLHEIAPIALGRFLGTAVLIGLTAYWIHLGALGLRETTELMRVILPFTPELAIIALAAVTSVFAVSEGLEVLGRMSIVLFIVSLGSFYAIGILNVGNMRPEAILPLFDASPLRIFAASLVPLGVSTAWMTSLAVASEVTIADSRGFTRTLLVALFVGLFVGLAAEVPLMMVFGDAVPLLTFPLLSLARQINIAEFISNIEGIFIVNILAGGFIQTAFLHYVTARMITHIFDLTSHRAAVLPLGMIISFLSIHSYGNLTDMLAYLRTTLPAASIAVHGVASLLLLLGGAVTKMRRDRSAPAGK